MPVGDRRSDEPRRWRPLVVVVALDGVPPEVRFGLHRVHHRDLLDGALTDIGDPQPAGHPIEAVPPRVPEPDTPHLGATAEVRVARRRPQPTSRFWDHSEHLAEEARRVLGLVSPVAGATTVTRADPEGTVGPEHEVAAVVVLEGLADPQVQDGPTARPSSVEGVGPDLRVAPGVREVQVEAGSVRGHGHAEEAALAPGRDGFGYVQDHLGGSSREVDGVHEPVERGHEDRPGPRRVGERRWTLEGHGDLDREARVDARRARGGHHRREPERRAGGGGLGGALLSGLVGRAGDGQLGHEDDIVPPHPQHSTDDGREHRQHDQDRTTPAGDGHAGSPAPTRIWTPPGVMAGARRFRSRWRRPGCRPCRW